jgi:hypothetical protein
LAERRQAEDGTAAVRSIRFPDAARRGRTRVVGAVVRIDRQRAFAKINCKLFRR